MSVLDNVQEQQSGSTEKAVSIRIPRKYPQAPEGLHRAICVSAEVKEVQEDTQYAKAGDKRIHFGWEIQDLTYQDEEGKDRKYRVWSKPMTMMFKKGKGKTPNIVAVMMKLTGYAPFVVKTKVNVDIGGGNMKMFDGEMFDQEMVKNMECNLVIAHDEWNGEMRAGIESYTTTEDQRKANFDLLPPEARAEFKGMPMETVKEEVPVEGEKIAPPVPAQGSSIEQAREKIQKMVTAEEYAAFETMVMSDFNPEEMAALQPDIDEMKKRLGM